MAYDVLEPETTPGPGYDVIEPEAKGFDVLEPEPALTTPKLGAVMNQGPQEVIQYGAPSDPMGTLKPVSRLDAITGAIRRSGPVKTLFGDPDAAAQQDRIAKQGVVGTALSLPSAVTGGVGKVAKAGVADLASSATPGLPDYMKGNLGDVGNVIRNPGEKLPVDVALEAARQQEKDDGHKFGFATVSADIANGLSEIAPKILAMPAGGLPTTMAGSAALFGYDERGNFSPRNAAFASLFPVVTGVTSQVADKAIAAGMQGGAAWLGSPAAQKAIHIAANQASMNALIVAQSSPELAALAQSDPDEFKRQLATIIGSNLAFAIPEVQKKFADLRPETPKATETAPEGKGYDVIQPLQPSAPPLEQTPSIPNSEPAPQEVAPSAQAPSITPPKPLATVADVLGAKVEAHRRELAALDQLHEELAKKEQTSAISPSSVVSSEEQSAKPISAPVEGRSKAAPEILPATGASAEVTAPIGELTASRQPSEPVLGKTVEEQNAKLQELLKRPADTSQNGNLDERATATDAADLVQAKRLYDALPDKQGERGERLKKTIERLGGKVTEKVTEPIPPSGNTAPVEERAVRPVSQRAREDGEIVRRFEQRLKQLQPDAMAPGAEIRAVERTGEVRPGERVLPEAVHTELEKALDSRIIFVRSSDGSELPFNGVHHSESAKALLVNAKADVSPLRVIMHEWTHRLEKADPKIYNWALQEVARIAPGLPQYHERLNARRAEQTMSPVKRAEAARELLGDVFGEQAHDPQFWDTLAGKDPGLFTKLANAVKRYLDRVLTKVGAVKGFDVDKYLSDVKQAREVVADAIKRFADGRTQSASPEPPKEGELKFSVKEKNDTTGEEAPKFATWNEHKAAVDKASEGLRDAIPLKWVRNRPAGMKPDEAHQAIAQAAAKYRTLQEDLLQRPDYVEHLLTDLHAKASKAGSDTSELEQIGAQLAAANPKLVEKAKADLVKRGVLPDKPVPILGRTLEKVTDWLSTQKEASPKATWRERLNVANRAAEAVDDARRLMGSAWTKLAAGWKQFVTAYKAPPVDTEFRSIVKDWNFRDEWTGLEVRHFVEEMNRKVPDPVRRQAISVWMDANGDAGTLKFQRDAVPDQYRPVWDAALKLTDTEKAIAQQLRQDFGQKLQDGMDAGLLEGGRADYGVPQRWKESPKTDIKTFAEGDDGPRSAGNPTSALDPRAPFFAMRRVVPDYFSGIMAGGKPESLDIAKLAGYYEMAFQKSLVSKDVVKALSQTKAEDGLPITKISGNAVPVRSGDQTAYIVDSKARAKEAFAKDGRPYKAIDHFALRGHKMVHTTSTGEKIVVRGDMLVHPEAYDRLKNMLGHSEKMDSKFYQNIVQPALKLNRFAKSSKLSLAAFHMTTEGLHAMFHLTNPFVGGFKIDLRDPVQARLVRNGLELGMAEQHNYFTEGVGSHGGIYAHIPGIREVMGTFGDYLFKTYIPTLKVKAGLNMLERNQKRYSGKLSEDQIYELTANQANAAFGAQNYRLLARSPVLRDIMSMGALAPDFLESRFKFVAQAFKPYNAEQRMALLFMAGSVYVGARLLNTLLDDDHDAHWKPEDAFSVFHGGRRYTLRTVVQDAAHLFFEPRSFWYNRMSFLSRTATELVTGRDWRGVKRTGMQQLGDLFSWLVSAGVEGMIPGTRKANEQSFPSAVLGSLGVGSRKATASGEIRDLAREYVRKNGTPAEQRSLAYDENVAHPESQYRDLNNALDSGDVEAARAEYQKLIKAGFKPEAIQERYRVFTSTGNLQSSWTGAIATDQKFFRTLTPAQRQTLRRAIEERKKRAAMLARVAR